jgi:hypothetical protein
MGKVALQQERLAVDAELDLVRAELATLDAEQQDAQRRYDERLHAFERYHTNVAAAASFGAECPQDDLVTGSGLAIYLGDFVSQPARDAALKDLESCRKTLDKAARKLMKSNIKDMQADFAVTIEDEFDENNPYSQGQLTTSVKALTLNVRMRGNFEGRARHSQDQVDSWCIASAGLFTKITLKNSHGTFSCSPDATPQDLMDSILEDYGLSGSWMATGDVATPTPPDPLPPPLPEPTQRRELLLAEVTRLETIMAGFDARNAQFLQQAVDAQRTVQRSDSRQQRRVEDWGQQKITRAGNSQIAGVAFVVIGGVILAGTVGALQAGVEGSRKFLPIGIGVSIPVVITGVLFFVGGGVRKESVRRQLGCAGATPMPARCMPSR